MDEAHRNPSESLGDGAWSKGEHAATLGMLMSLRHAELLSVGPAALPGMAAEFSAETKFDDLFEIFVVNAASLPGRTVLMSLAAQARNTSQLALFSPNRGAEKPPQFGERDAEGGPEFWVQYVHHRKELVEKCGAVVVHDDFWLRGSPPHSRSSPRPRRTRSRRWGRR
jgi:hypothetical protein